MTLDMRSHALVIVPENDEEKLAIQTIYLGFGGRIEEFVPYTGPIAYTRREHPREPIQIAYR